MTVLTHLPVENIHHRRDARHRSDDALSALADSIKDIGLLNPIRVRRLGDDQYEVVAGSHRLQAVELLGWREIAAIVSDDDDLHAELAMIDENLMRAELTPSDRAIQTARRKAIYLELHPETAEHVAGGKGNATVENFSAVPAFASDMAAKTGQTDRTIRLLAERGEKVIAEAFEAIRGTPLDTGAYLDKLKRIAPADQLAIAQRDLASPRQQRAQPLGGISARYTEPPASVAKPPSENFDRFIRLADEMEALRGTDLIASSGRQRAVLGQRASSLADFMSTIMEGLSQ